MEKIKMNLKKISETIIEFPETEGLPLCDHTYKFTYYENEYGDEFTTFKIDDEIVFTVRNMSPSMLLSQPSSFILEELGMGFLTTINVDSIHTNEYYADDVFREVELYNILPTEVMLTEFNMLSSDMKLKGQQLVEEEDIPIKNIKLIRYLSSSGLYAVLDLIVDEDGNTEESVIYNSFYDGSKYLVTDIFTLYRYKNWLKNVRKKYDTDTIFLSCIRNFIKNVISPNCKYINEDGEFIYEPESIYSVPYVISTDEIENDTDDQLYERVDTIVFNKAMEVFDTKRKGIYNYTPFDIIKVYKPTKPEGSSEFYGMLYYASDISRTMIIDYTGKYVYLHIDDSISSAFNDEQMTRYNIYQIDGRYYIKCGLIPNVLNTAYECSFIKSIISYFDELDLSNIHDSHITFIDEYTTALKNVKIIIK